MTPLTRTRRPGQRLSKAEREKAQEVFLQSFSMTANVRAACLKAGISRNTVYEWAEHDAEFSIKYKQAELDANDMIRAELFRRAVQGYEKPVVSMGRQVFVKETVNGKETDKPLMERVYSDNLLALLAKARMPEFRDKQHVDVSANVSASVRSDMSDELRILTGEQLAQLKSWLLEAKAREG